jgi:hypothetical protein
MSRSWAMPGSWAGLLVGIELKELKRILEFHKVFLAGLASV